MNYTPMYFSQSMFLTHVPVLFAKQPQILTGHGCTFFEFYNLQARKSQTASAAVNSQLKSADNSAAVQGKESWVNCDELPSPPKPVKKYDSNESSGAVS